MTSQRNILGSQRIIGGQNAETPIPWQAEITIYGSDGLFYHCGGSIISSDTIVTAAHCVTSVPDGSKFEVRAGSTDFNNLPQVC